MQGKETVVASRRKNEITGQVSDKEYTQMRAWTIVIGDWLKIDKR